MEKSKGRKLVFFGPTVYNRNESIRTGGLTPRGL